MTRGSLHEDTSWHAGGEHGACIGVEHGGGDMRAAQTAGDSTIAVVTPLAWIGEIPIIDIKVMRPAWRGAN